MKSVRNGLTLAAREHLLSGQPLTKLEAMVMFGVLNLPEVVSGMRKQGWVIHSKSVPFAAANNRLNQYALLQPPANLPVRDILVTEYWISK